MLKLEEPYRNEEIFNIFFSSSDVCYASKKFVFAELVDILSLKHWLKVTLLCT